MPALDPLPGVSAPAPQELELRPAKVGDRFIAYCFDAVPFGAGVLATVVQLMLKLHEPVPPLRFARIGAAWFGGYLLYQFLGTATGGTLGKRLMGLKVLRTDGQPLGVFGSLVRSLGYAISTPFFNFGFLIALVHPESRALHDLLSGSVVVEPRPRSAAESAVLFLGALCLLGGMFGGTVFVALRAPVRAQLAMVQKARDGLVVLAAIEEAYKEKNGVYTRSVSDLAKASGDEAKFMSALNEIFYPEEIEIQAGNKAYRITGSARDRRRTRVRLEGPPPVLLP